MLIPLATIPAVAITPNGINVPNKARFL